MSMNPPEPAEDRQITTTPCPICKKATREDAETFPFCSKRCRIIDLGKWIDGDYQISRPITNRDEELFD